jgi:hypothetical protein
MTSPLDADGNIDALRIYQESLDTLSRAVMSLDLDGCAALYNLPVQVRTLTGEMVIETDKDLRDGYEVYAQSLIGQGATDLLWLASTARWISPDFIEGFHVTHILRKTMPLTEPYHSRVVMRLVGDTWKIDEIEIQVPKTQWPVMLPSLPDGRAVAQSFFKFARGDARSTVANPLSVYALFLRDYSAFNMAHDFENWSAMHLYPHTTHTDFVDKTIKGPEGNRPFFDMVSRLIREHGCDRFERAPSRAEFLSANQICGYHTGTMYAGDKIVLGPVKSRMILQRVGPTWFLRSVTNAVANDQFPYNEPQVSSELTRLLDIQNRKRE